MGELLLADEQRVDTLNAPQMANWLRETARITRARGQATPTPAEMRVAPHVAFRLEQAADLLEQKEREIYLLRNERDNLADNVHRLTTLPAVGKGEVL